MEIRVGHEAFQSGPGAYRLHDNLVTWIVWYLRLAQLTLTLAIHQTVRPTPHAQEQNIGRLRQSYLQLVALSLRVWLLKPVNELFKSGSESFVYGAIGHVMANAPTTCDVLYYSPKLPGQTIGIFMGRYFDPLISLMVMTRQQATHGSTSTNDNLEITQVFNPCNVGNAPSNRWTGASIVRIYGDAIENENECVLSVRSGYVMNIEKLNDRKTIYHVKANLSLCQSLRSSRRSHCTDNCRMHIIVQGLLVCCDTTVELA